MQEFKVRRSKTSLTRHSIIFILIVVLIVGGITTVLDSFKKFKPADYGYFFLGFGVIMLPLVLWGSTIVKRIKLKSQPTLIFDRNGIMSHFDERNFFSCEWKEIKSFVIETRRLDYSWDKESIIKLVWLSRNWRFEDEGGPEYYDFTEIIKTKGMDKTPVEIIEAFRYFARLYKIKEE